MKRLLLSLLLLSPMARADDLADATPAIERANRDWLPAMRDHDAARIAEPYAGDGVFVLANGKTIQGRDAIRAYYASGFADIGAPVSGGIQHLGQAAAGPGQVYEWGRGILDYRDRAGRPMHHEGLYLTVWRKTADGWRIVRNLVF